MEIEDKDTKRVRKLKFVDACLNTMYCGAQEKFNLKITNLRCIIIYKVMVQSDIMCATRKKLICNLKYCVKQCTEISLWFTSVRCMILQS